MTIRGDLTAVLAKVIAALSDEEPTASSARFTRPRLAAYGDLSTNAAFLIASTLGEAPPAVAHKIADELEMQHSVRKVEVAGNGFINVFLFDGWLHQELKAILARGGSGKRQPTGERVLVEFVSANPTGPLTIGSARNAVIGDALARILEESGHSISREYYINDAGRQMVLFGESVAAAFARKAGIDKDDPPDGYKGDYIAALAASIFEDFGADFAGRAWDAQVEILRNEAPRRVLEGIRHTLERFGIAFDRWFSETDLHTSGAIDRVVATLVERGQAYRDESSAIFFRSTSFGDDKDRVLIRSSGESTYFAADCAYLVDKFNRGFDSLVYVWGADHHGAVKRLLGAAEALGFDPGRVHILIYQLITLLENDDQIRMSKRAGQIVTIDALLDEIGADAARYALLSHPLDSHMQFDLGRVTARTLDNPVYYVQYAYARLRSIQRRCEEAGLSASDWEGTTFDSLKDRSELDLLASLTDFEAILEICVDHMEPHHLIPYAERLAAAFHRFYGRCRVLGSDNAKARLGLVSATEITLGKVLGLIGIAQPERMEALPAAEAEGRGA